MNPALKRKLIDLGLDMPGGTPEAFVKFISEDTVTAAKVIKTAKIQPE
jgi:tripartite-type tricarboxylate transporter receptor subunit TctC